MDYATAIPISVGIIAVVGGLLKFKSSGNGNGKGKHMSDEARVSVTKLWDQKQDTKMCDHIVGGFKDDITEIKESQKDTKRGIQDIQQTLINWKP